MSLLVTEGILLSCTEDTAAVGADIIPWEDNVSASQATYRATSKSVRIDSVLANTSDCYLGSIIDPETRSRTTCDFLAQFHVMESYLFPAKEKMVLNEQGRVEADSCDIRIYFDEYYGDSLASMKLLVQELDTNRVMEENVAYYTDIDPKDYVSTTSDVRKAVTYSVYDQTKPNGGASSTYYRSIVVRLPASYGSYILNSYYDNPEYFKNSYQFIHHVCPGFYFQTSGGVGSMVKVQVSALNVYFKYHTRNAAGNDTIVDGMQRMAATEEVIQNMHIDNSIPQDMLDGNAEYSYVKSPTGIFTQLTLPVNEIVAGEHHTDSINSVKISLRRYNNTNPNPHNLKAPETILMVRADELFPFFEEERLSNSRDSYLATYTPGIGAYVFSNIAALVTQMKNERDKGAGITPSDTEAQRTAKYKQWEATHPNWNKVMLVPVKTEYSSSVNSYGLSTKKLLRVRNDFSMSSVRLEGGSAGVEVSVIYSKFSK